MLAIVSLHPASLPAFFRERADPLAWLNPEPDRWRNRELREMERAAYDHDIDWWTAWLESEEP